MIYVSFSTCMHIVVVIFNCVVDWLAFVGIVDIGCLVISTMIILKNVPWCALIFIGFKELHVLSVFIMQNDVLEIVQFHLFRAGRVHDVIVFPRLAQSRPTCQNFTTTHQIKMHRMFLHVIFVWIITRDTY